MQDTKGSTPKTVLVYLGAFVAVAAILTVSDPPFLVGLLIIGVGVFVATVWVARIHKGVGVTLLAVLAAGAAAGPPDAQASRLERQAANTAVRSSHMVKADRRALIQAGRTGAANRVWHPAAKPRTAAQIHRRMRGVQRYVRRHLRRQQARESLKPMTHAAARTSDYHGLALTTNIALMVANSHLVEPMRYVYARNGETIYQVEQTCPDATRRWGTPDEVSASCSSYAAVNVLATCPGAMAWVTGNDLFYTTGWTGQGTVTVVDLCLAGDIGPIRSGWGGPDRTFAERAVPEVAPLINAYFGWTA